MDYAAEYYWALGIAITLYIILNGLMTFWLCKSVPVYADQYPKQELFDTYFPCYESNLLCFLALFGAVLMPLNIIGIMWKAVLINRLQMIAEYKNLIDKLDRRFTGLDGKVTKEIRDFWEQLGTVTQEQKNEYNMMRDRCYAMIKSVVPEPKRKAKQSR